MIAFRALKLLQRFGVRFLATIFLGALFGSLIGGLEGVFLAFLYIVIEGVRQSDASFISFLAPASTMGMILGAAVGLLVGAASFGVLHLARTSTKRRDETDIAQAVSVAAWLAFLCAPCGMLVGYVLFPDSRTGDNLGPIEATIFAWSVGFFFGALLGGLNRESPQTGIAPLDWLLRWMWR